MNKLRFIAASTLIAIASHTYLLLSYYPLKFGRLTEKSFCNLNATFNCDAVAASAYSSFLNIPLAVWGAATNFIFLTLILIYALNLSDHRLRYLRYSFYLALFTAAASVVMAIISFSQINTYCIFCIAAYILSFINLTCVYLLLKGKEIPVFADIKNLFTTSRLALGLLVLIPFISFVVHRSMVQQYLSGNISAYVNSSISEWSSNSPQDFSKGETLTYGPQNAKMIITEFADFLCSHCKTASPSIKAFLQAHPDVGFQFFAFPLDGKCNPKIKRNHGLSCHLSKTVYCAEKQSLGWEFHDAIFENQAHLYRSGSIKNINKLYKQWKQVQKIDWEKLNTCIKSKQAHQAMKNSSLKGDKAGVLGTPTIYVNGKKLPRGQFLPVLKAIYSRINK